MDRRKRLVRVGGVGSGVCVEKQGMGRGVEKRESVWRIYIRIWKNAGASKMKRENHPVAYPEPTGESQKKKKGPELFPLSH